MNRMSGSVSTYTRMSMSSRSSGSASTRIPSTMTTGAGSTRRVLSFRRWQLKSYFGHLDGLAPDQRLQVLHQQRRLEAVGVVVVDQRPLLERQVGEVAVVRVVMEQTHGDPRHLLDHAAHDRRLAGSASAGDAENERAVVIPPDSPARCCFSFQALWAAAFSTHGLRWK